MIVTHRFILNLLTITFVGGILAWATNPVLADSDEANVLMGWDVQVYPAGVISGLKIEWLYGSQDSIALRAAYNLTERQDFGLHDNESGGGSGGGVGYRHYLDSNKSGLFMGVRTDIWSLEIDWRDDFDPLNRPLENLFLNPYLNTTLPAELDVRRQPLFLLEVNPLSDVHGTTRITVVQPTIELGYAFELSKNLRLDLNVALGAEFNTSSQGEDVGHGAILLWGFGLAYRI